MLYSSAHISIHKLKTEDALQLNKFLVSNTERFIRYLPKTLEENSTLESTQNYVKEKIAKATTNSEFVYVIKDKYGIEIVGLIILKNLDWNLKQGEFAYCIGNRYKGQNWMSEAVIAISKYAMEELGLKSIQIIAHKTNHSSIKVAQQSGFKWKETLMNEFTPLNEAPLNMELYEFKHER